MSYDIEKARIHVKEEGVPDIIQQQVDELFSVRNSLPVERDNNFLRACLEHLGLWSKNNGDEIVFVRGLEE